MIDVKKEEIQKKAVKSCIDSISNGYLRATCELATGSGKTFISFWLIHYLKPKNVLFLAETQLRWKNILEDAEKFKQYYNIDISEDRLLEFACYQSAYKWNGLTFDMVIADEIHDSLTPKYFQFYQNNHYNHLLGLSATIDNNRSYVNNNVEYGKLDMLNEIAPIAFTYSLRESIENKTSRKLNIIVIKHHLDTTTKNIPIKYKDKSTQQEKVFFKTEYDYYDYYNKQFYRVLYQKDKNEFLIRLFMNRRNSILYKAPSKMLIVKKLMMHLERVLIFGNDIDSISALVPTVSSRNKPATNNDIIDKFCKNELNVIGSFKMLKQGVNLKNLNNIIMHSYYGVPKDSIQRIGRLRASNSDGFVFILLTAGTQEEVWFNNMTEPFKEHLIFCENVEEALKIWKSYQK